MKHSIPIRRGLVGAGGVAIMPRRSVFEAVLVGGGFTSFNGVPRNDIVRLQSGAAATPPIRLEPRAIDNGTASISVTGSPGETFDVPRAPCPHNTWPRVGIADISPEGTAQSHDNERRQTSRSTR